MSHEPQPPETAGHEDTAGREDACRSAERRRAALIVRVLAVLLAAGGWWVSADLLRLSFGGAASNPWLAARCGGEEAASDCLSVLRSERAFMRSARGAAQSGGDSRGIPWAAAGMAYFAFVAVWFALVGPPRYGQRWWHLLVAIPITMGAWQSALLILTMATELHRWCGGCVVTHVINFGLLLLTLAAFPWRRPRGASHVAAHCAMCGQTTTGQRPVPHAASRYPTRSLALAGGLAAFGIGYLQIVGYSLMERSSTLTRMSGLYNAVVADPEYVRWSYGRKPAVDIPLRDDEAWLGPADAPNTVVAFVDFQCPACRLACEKIASVVEKRRPAGGRSQAGLRATFRHFPQDSACNPHYPTRGHPAACDAARATEAARLLGGPAGFERMRRLLYGRQHDLETRRFAVWAAEAGFDAEPFARAMDDPRAAARVGEDATVGGRLGLRSTPALFLNGRPLQSWQSDATWDALLDSPAASQPRE